MVVESWAGRTPNEIAAELNCHPQTVRIHVTRRLPRRGLAAWACEMERDASPA
jgi:predicted transcriptional regulator